MRAVEARSSSCDGTLVTRMVFEKSIRTSLHKIGIFQELLCVLHQWEECSIRRRVRFHYPINILHAIQVICQCDTIVLFDFQNFMLTIAVEGSPLDEIVVLAPVEECGVTFVGDTKLAA
jgi:hypothetical protein